MVKGPLVDRLAERGRRLIELLDEAGIRARAALWLYRPESEDWKLVLGLPDLRRTGPRAAYTQIQGVFAANEDVLRPLKFDDIMVQDPSDRLLTLLGSAIQTGPAITEIRFTNNRVGDTLIEDALIYRLQAS